ncbi:hypothetical protein [Mycobacterium sp. RTGN5]|uniref:hypothetical protein n=1 Tax=Mycobacterium sp. RTGN5 TaxID=3016522 RepID=UPI0029C66903|nr:hypothetical protein [Mycobacterium sp. RTGN5]
MTVVIDRVGDAVRDAGGWMCDRVWAGWDVTAWVPAGLDITPLRILGVSVRTLDDERSDLWPGPRPAAVAIGSGVTALPHRIRTRIDALMHSPGTEVTIWGDGRSLPGDRFHDVEHRLSAAAIAFKTQAMQAASLPGTCGATEDFRGYAPWQPQRAVADTQRITGS